MIFVALSWLLNKKQMELLKDVPLANGEKYDNYNKDSVLIGLEIFKH
jgi:hypothetical protein